MEVLESADWQRLNEFLKALYAPCSLDNFPVRLMTALLNVIDSDLNGVVSFSVGDEATLPRVITFPDPSIGIAAMAFIGQSQQRLLSYPLVERYVQTLDGQASTISDHWSELEFHQQSLPQIDFLKNFGIEDQMGIGIELLPKLKTLPKTNDLHHVEEHLSLLVSRDRRNFSDRDRLILNLIRPHLKQAYDNLIILNQVNHQLTEQQTAIEQTALIALSASGAVQWMTQQAGEILHRYFPPSKTQIALPDVLQRWSHRQLSIFFCSTDIDASTRPLVLQMGNRRLTIRSSYSPETEQLYLSLEETDPNQFSIDSLQLLGLTKRESEVLFWVTKHKSLMEVSKQLGMSDRTAKKHLEHIYEKFGVQTRLSAVMYALEHLGIFS